MQINLATEQGFRDLCILSSSSLLVPLCLVSCGFVFVPADNPTRVH